MERQRFEAYLKAAQASEWPLANLYLRGLRRHFHGCKHGTQADHEKLMALDDERGEAYRLGFDGSPPPGVHGQTGNKNAAKPEQQVTQCFRWQPSEKAAVVKHTQAQGIKLSDFIREAVHEKLEREG